MAIAIKSIPILNDKSAEAFTVKEEKNLKNKSTVNFSVESSVALKIIKKAKI